MGGSRLRVSKFRPNERPAIDEAIRRSAEAVEHWMKRGIDSCMNEYNREQEKK